MKMKNIFYCIIGSVLLLSCNNWLDVSPKSQVKEEGLFKSQAGFRDALTGIYTVMARPESYGAGQTMSLLDVLAQTYSEVGVEYQHALVYDYKAAGVRDSLAALWKNSYKAIANCNYILKNIEAKKGIFSPGVYEVVKGECLALRAFLHFDLLRGFAPSYLSGAQQAGIPYADRITNQPFPQLTVEQCIGRILADADSARTLIRPFDPIGPEGGEYTEDYNGSTDLISDDGFWLYRKSRMNYYGMTALMARIYLYKSDNQQAVQMAREVIESGRFALVTAGQVTSDQLKDKALAEVMAEQEYIAALYVNHLNDRSAVFFKETGNEARKLYITDQRKAALFGPLGIDIDWRSLFLFRIPQDESKSFIAKYMDGDVIPLLKLSELYLIMAEGTGDVYWLEQLRAHRGYENHPLPEPVDLAAEIRAEYQREFLAEGQLFYFYKRLDYRTIPNTAQEMGPAVYVFPIPDDEIEFGNIKIQEL